MNPNAVYVKGGNPPNPGPRKCLRCGYEPAPSFKQTHYMAHAKECLANAIATWDADRYSATYFAQVRAISRYRGDVKRRSKFKSWAWWAVKPDGPALVQAEVAG